MSRSATDAWHASGPLQERIYLVVRQIPAGKVSTYGDIAAIVGDCTARMVGYAMAAANDSIPWHRVINAQGKISPRGDGGGEQLQRARLEDEGIAFNADGKVNLVCPGRGIGIDERLPQRTEATIVGVRHRKGGRHCSFFQSFQSQPKLKKTIDRVAPKLFGDPVSS